MYEYVNHPKHYNYKGKECWDEMYEQFGPEATISFCCLNAYKYVYRAGSKPNNSTRQDLDKGFVYLNHAKKLLDTLDNTDTKIKDIYTKVASMYFYYGG